MKINNTKKLNKTFSAILIFSTMLAISACDSDIYTEKISDITEEITEAIPAEPEVNESENNTIPENSEADADADSQTAENNTVEAVTEEQAKIPFSSHGYSTKAYTEIVTELESCGFTNITVEPEYDLDTGWIDSAKKDKTSKVLINGNEKFKKNEEISINSEIIIYYHDFELSNPDIQFTPYTVAEMIKDLEENAFNAEEKYMDQYVQISGRLDNIDSDGKYISIYPANDKYAFIGVQCNIKTEEQKEKLKTLKTGNKVTVTGKITSVGEILGYSLDISSIL